MSVPTRMRAAITRTPGEASVEIMDVPRPGPGDVLVKVAVVGVCAGDTAPWYVQRKVPCVLGHEPAGTVVEVGAAVTGFSKGDRVFVHHHAPCFRCRACLSGNPTTCPTWRSSRLDPGGLAEYVRVPSENLGDTLVLPDDVALEAAALVEPLACCVKAYRRVGLRPGESVLVIGLGSMGHLLGRLARALGAPLVMGADTSQPRRRRAEGAFDVVLDPGPDLRSSVLAANAGRLADVVIVGPGDVKAMEAGLSATAPGGRWCSFWPTPPEQRLSVSPHDLYFDEVTLHFSYSCGPQDTRDALAWIRRGVVRVEDIVTHRFPLERTAEAFALTREAGDSLKALVILDAAAAGGVT